MNPDDAEKGRALVHRLFALDRLSAEWEQALAELRAWSMSDWDCPVAVPNRRGTIMKLHTARDLAMTDIYDKTRVVFAKRVDEEYPFAIGAVSEMSSGVIDQETWDAAKREMTEKWLGPDAGSYEFVEVVVVIPNGDIAAMFDARQIIPASIAKDETA